MVGYCLKAVCITALPLAAYSVSTDNPGAEGLQPQMSYTSVLILLVQLFPNPLNSIYFSRIVYYQ